jgi:hypothetical protein
LTGVSFNWKTPGVDFKVIGSTVEVATGSKLYYDQKPNHYLPTIDSQTCDISSEWGLARNITLQDNDSAPLGSYKFSVTATKPLNDIDAVSPFSSKSFTVPNPGGLSGADFGLVSDWESRMSGDIKTKIVIADSVKITLKPYNCTLTSLDIANATFNYGYYQENANHQITHHVVGVADDFVPEPATLVVWSLFGLCWVGGRCWQRQRRETMCPTWQRGNRTANRCTTRQPWPAHTRAAILEIIERGCPR